MKQAEIKNDTDYIIGPSSKLFESAAYHVGDPDAVPYRMAHVRIVDNRRYKASTMYSNSRREPRLVEENEKPNRSFYAVGPLARGVKIDGSLTDEAFVVKPQDVRMEWNAWREEYTRRGIAEKEAAEQRRQRRIDEEIARRAFEKDRNRRVTELNRLLEGSKLEAKVAGNEVVLTGAPADLLDAAEKLSKVVVP